MPEIDDRCDDADDGDDDEEDVVVLDEIAPMTAEERAGPYQEQSPRDGADDGENREFPEGIASDTGRERDKGPDAGQAAANEDGSTAVLIEHVFCHLEFVLVKEDVLAVF